MASHSSSRGDATNNEAGHYWPELLSDGDGVVFATMRAGVGGGGSATQIAVASLRTGEWRVLAQGTYPKVGPTGELIFSRVFSLWLAHLDHSQLRLTDEPVPVLENVGARLNGWAAFDVAGDGTLVYEPASAAGGDLRLMWLDRNGDIAAARDEQLVGEYHPPVRLSPDGTRLAVTAHPEGGEDSVIIHDLERGIRTPLVTAARWNSRYPVWTPDGRRITFASQSAGSWDIYSMPATGGVQPEALLVREDDQMPMSWTPDGRVLAFEQRGAAGFDIWQLPVGGEPSPLVATPASERAAAFSPDGRWLTYVSNETGRDEVYVQVYPGPGERLQASTSGGAEPVWARSGTQLFYVQDHESIMVVNVELTPTARVSRPIRIARGQLNDELGPPNYDVALDDSRFLIIHDLNVTPPELHVVQNGFEELKRPVPVGN